MKQKHAVSLGLLILLIISCGKSGKADKQSDPYARYDTYETAEYSIRYPHTWRLDTSGYMGTDFSIFSKQTSLLDKFIENVNLLISDVPDSLMDITTYKQLTEEKIKSIATDSVLLESELISANGTTYHKLVYTQQQRIYFLKFQQYYWLKNGKVYELTLACKENEFNTYIERGELMLNSFILK